jgi:hypothetical protein
MKKLCAAVALATGIALAVPAHAASPVPIFPRLAPGAAGIGAGIAGAAIGIIVLAIVSGITSPRPPKNPGYKGNPYLPGPHCKITPTQRKCA